MANRSSIKANEEELKAYFADLAAQKPVAALDLESVQGTKSKATPYIWHWRDLRPLAMRAAELVGTKEAERRVLVLSNPGTQWGAANTLFANIQVVLPGEVVRSHRHTNAALRFIIEGKIGYTVVNGQRYPMVPGDLVITPSWSWHDHAEQIDIPMLWLDSLDRPLVRLLEVGTKDIPTRFSRLARATTTRRQGTAAAVCVLRGSLRRRRLPYPHVSLPTGAGQSGAGSARCRRSGITLRRDHLGVHKPHYGRTRNAHHWLLHPATASGRAHRVPSSHLVRLLSRGRGLRLHGDRRPATGLGGGTDIFSVPALALREHVNSSDRPAIVFSVTDIPVKRALGYYREQASPIGRR